MLYKNEHARLKDSSPTSVHADILYSKKISKYDKTGKYLAGSIQIDVKQLLNAKFIQLTQEKTGFAGSPSKISSVTFDFSQKEIKEGLSEAMKIYENAFNKQ